MGLAFDFKCCIHQAAGDAVLIYHLKVDNSYDEAGSFGICEVEGKDVIWAVQYIMTWPAKDA